MPEYTTGEGNIVFPEGDYDFLVVDAGEKESQSGNVMIELELVCTNAQGEKITVIDRLVFVKKATFKIDDFRRSTGEKLVNGAVTSLEADECIDRRGRCHLIIEVYNGRSRNKVDAYIVPEPSQAVRYPSPVSSPAEDPAEEPDQIPF